MDVLGVTQPSSSLILFSLLDLNDDSLTIEKIHLIFSSSLSCTLGCWLTRAPDLSCGSSTPWTNHQCITGSHSNNYAHSSLTPAARVVWTLSLYLNSRGGNVTIGFAHSEPNCCCYCTWIEPVGGWACVWREVRGQRSGALSLEPINEQLAIYDGLVALMVVVFLPPIRVCVGLVVLLSRGYLLMCLF